VGAVGKYEILLGAASFVVAIMIDGLGFPYFARLWLAASASDKTSILWAADAVHTVDRALFPVWSGLFIGLGMVLIAIAAWRSAEHSRISAALGIIGGLMSLIYAIGNALEFTVAFPLWPWGPALVAIWVTLAGIAMLRKSAQVHGIAASLHEEHEEYDTRAQRNEDERM